MYLAWPYLALNYLSGSVANPWDQSDPVYSVNIASIRNQLINLVRLPSCQ